MPSTHPAALKGAWEVGEGATARTLNRAPPAMLPVDRQVQRGAGGSGTELRALLAVLAISALMVPTPPDLARLSALTVRGFPIAHPMASRARLASLEPVVEAAVAAASWIVAFLFSFGRPVERGEAAVPEAPEASADWEVAEAVRPSR